MTLRLRDGISGKVVYLETNDLLWSIGYYGRQGKILQINNTKVRDS